MRYEYERVEMRDIGAFDTSPNGCRYCYANQSLEHTRALQPARPSCALIYR